MDIVPIWCTFNEPSVFVAQGYFNGIFPPGKKDPVLAGTVLENMLNAHVETYHLLKAIPGSEKVKIGLVKNIFQFDPLRRWHLLDWAFSKILNDVYTNAPLEFLKTGKSSFYMPGMVDNEMLNPEAPGTLDFIGLNYYSGCTSKEGSILKSHLFLIRETGYYTDMGYPLYAEGFYRALKTISEVGFRYTSQKMASQMIKTPFALFYREVLCMRSIRLSRRELTSVVTSIGA